jgi:hypothetical protein
MIVVAAQPPDTRRRGNRHVDVVKVSDRCGETRTGVVVLGTFWHPFGRQVRAEGDPR